MNASELIKRIAFSRAYEFLDRDPEQNFLKLVDWLEKLDKNGYIAKQLPIIKKYAKNPDSNWYQLARSLWEDVDDEVRKTLFTNFMINGNLLENQKLIESRKKFQCNIPWMIMLDPTSACNLNCIGCQTAIPETLGLSFDDMDSIVEQGKELGVYYYIFSGEEPMNRRDDMIALCNKNSDCVFLCRTNGTMIDEDFAKELLRVRNLIPAISLDEDIREAGCACEEATFAAQRAAMDILREYRLAFGVFCCYSSSNWDFVSSEAFFDSLISLGAKFAWFTAYLPIGESGRPEKMVTAEQRETLYHRIHQFRKTKAILTLDLWNDGAITGGCLGGGRNYCHINARGDMEPCAFLHYSDSNIHEKSLLEALRSPLFQSFRKNQPFDLNLLRSCPLMDHPEYLHDLVSGSCVVSSGLREQEDLEVLAQKCRKHADAWAAIAERLWRENHEDHKELQQADGGRSNRDHGTTAVEE